MAKQGSSRAVAAQICRQIIDQGQSLDRSLEKTFKDNSSLQDDRSLIQEIVYGVCRWYGELDSIVDQLLSKPIRNKDRIIHFLLLVGVYQLKHLSIPQHAVVSETVAATRLINKQWSKNLVNACLREFLRQEWPIDNSAQLSHPQWMIEKIEEAWPNYSHQIFQANNQRPPMCIRVNSIHNSREQYLKQLEDADIAAHLDPYSQDGLVLEKACPVDNLPGFDAGSCSVQDSAAQLVTQLFSIDKGLKILDACAAPGGKAAHILEICANDCELFALDVSQPRCLQLENTFDRLGLKAKTLCADASDVTSWNKADDLFDRILIDAPCSGLGVIRRHPDIRHHRTINDIEQLKQAQKQLLENLWAILKPGGLMMYTTCSILPEENEQQVSLFLSQQNNAILRQFNHPNALALEVGFQTLPGVHDMDGFYYCLIEKSKD